MRLQGLDRLFEGHPTAELYVVMICCPLLLNICQVRVGCGPHNSCCLRSSSCQLLPRAGRSRQSGVATDAGSHPRLGAEVEGAGRAGGQGDGPGRGGAGGRAAGVPARVGGAAQRSGLRRGQLPASSCELNAPVCKPEHSEDPCVTTQQCIDNALSQPRPTRWRQVWTGSP